MVGRHVREVGSMEYQHLDRIDSPEDLRSLPSKKIPELNLEIRDFLIRNTVEHGGHLASNLGVVELSVALHRVFDSPRDHIIWDVGHQSYVHKLLTGRRRQFRDLRVPGGLSGFTKRSESEHDAFGAGHSSTSVSAALGFARADALSGNGAYTVAVIGDGAFTGGMVHEALNNVAPDMRLIIILNENEMSISRNIGTFARYIARIRSSKSYNRVKKNTTSVLRRVPLVGKPLFRLGRWTKKLFKNLIYHSNFFEELGLFYIGPIDGNDYRKTEQALRYAKMKGEPVVIHLHTKKGKGYEPAEKDPCGYHGVAANPSDASTFSRAFGDALSELAERDERVTAVTAAMGVGTGLEDFAGRYTDRYFDVGIAEEHALTFSAGLAAAGMRPYVAVYSTFLQRAYDSIVHDIALQGLPVHIMVDRAGLAVSDGPTHHGIFDVAFISHIPGITLYAPISFGSLRAIMEKTRDASTTVAIRYPNRAESCEINAAFYPDGDYENFGIRAYKTEDADALVITYGCIVSEALAAAELLRKDEVRLGILLLEELKPYDHVSDRLANLIGKERPIVFLEEGVYDGGAAMLLAERLGERGCLESGHRILAIRDHFASPESACDLLAYCGIDRASIVEAVKGLLSKVDKN